jgi:hypothetical protein
MTQADRVLSTPPTNTPVDTTRRRFLSQAAGVAVGGSVWRWRPSHAKAGRYTAVR